MAQAFAESGARSIAILDVQREVGDKAARELSEQSGVDVRFYSIDVRTESKVSQTVQDIVNYFGGVDILVNAAGIAE